MRKVLFFGVCLTSGSLSQTLCTSPLGFFLPEMIYRVIDWFCVSFVTTETRSFNSHVNS